MPELFFDASRPYSGPPLLTAERPAKVKYRPPTELLENPDAIVIGSGIGGLGIASILAQKRGARVLLFPVLDKISSRSRAALFHLNEEVGSEARLRTTLSLFTWLHGLS